MDRVIYSLHLLFGPAAALFYAAMALLLVTKREEEPLKRHEKAIAHAARISLLGAFASGLLAAVYLPQSIGTPHYYAGLAPLFILIAFRVVLAGRQPTYRAYRILFSLLTIAICAGLVTGFLY